jgi:Cu/Ag efflux protein CusF
MNAFLRSSLSLLAISATLAGCTSNQPKATQQQYPVKGKILAIDLEKPSVKLDHEDIPGLMQAMKMQFGVANVKLLEGLKVDDQVQGQLKVESGKYIITELQKR